MRLVLDTDPGNGVPGADIDDGLAIGLALTSPEVQLEAITVVAGNVPVDRGVACALEILEAAQVDAVPVHRGADRPLVEDPAAWRALLDDDRRDDERARRLWAGIGPRRLHTRAHPTPAAYATCWWPPRIRRPSRVASPTSRSPRGNATWPTWSPTA